MAEQEYEAQIKSLQRDNKRIQSYLQAEFRKRQELERDFDRAFSDRELELHGEALATAFDIVERLRKHTEPTFDKDGKPIVKLDTDFYDEIRRKYGKRVTE